MIFRIFVIALCVLGIPLVTWAAPITIYSDDFNGLSTTDLNGQAPDVRPGAQTWLAGLDWQADGSKTNSSQGAYLPFVPAANKLYELSLDVNPTTFGGTGSNSSDWFALIFSTANPPSATVSPNQNTSFAWMLQRIDRSGNSIQSFTGANTANGAPYDATPDNVGFVNLKIRLDTNPALWTAEWFVNDASIRGPIAIGASNPNIQYVGFGSLRSGGAVDNFLLVEAVPEPTTWCLSLLGIAGLAVARRRRHHGLN